MKVILVASITADGFIAKKSDQSSLDWTSREDTKFFVQKTKETGYLIMGSKTFDTINSKHLPFKDRTIIVLTRSKKFEQFSRDEVRAESGSAQEICEKLSQEGVDEVVLAGGSEVYTQFIANNLVDEVFLTVEPVFFGEGVKLFNEKIDISMELIEVIDLSSQTKVLHFKINKSQS